MRWWRTFLWTGLGLVLVIAAGVSYLFLVDLGRFKSQIESIASEATGREVEINGKLSIDLAPHSVVIAEDIRIGNAPWAEQADLVNIERLEVRLDLRSVFSRTVVVESVDVAGANIDLIKPEQGEPNWVLGPAASKQTSDAPATAGKGLIVERIKVADVTLSFRGPERDKPLLLRVDQLQQQHRDDDFLEFSLTGSLNDRVLKLDGEVGSWAGLLAGKNVRFIFGARLDAFVLNADGAIDELLHPYRPRIEFTAAAPDVNDLLQVLGVRQKGQGAIDLSGSLLPTDSGPLQLDIAGRFGRLDIDVGGEFSDLQDLEKVDLDVLASGDDVRPILEAFGLPQSQPSPFMIKVDATRDGSSLVINKGDMVLGEAKFGLSARLPEFPRIDDSVIELKIDGPAIERFREVFNLPGAATGPFSASVSVDVAQDGFELLDIEARTSLGEVIAKGRIGAAPDFYGTTLDMQLNSPSLAILGDAYGIAALPEQAIEITGAVRYDSNGIRTIEPLLVIGNDTSMQVEGLIKPVAGVIGSDLAFVLQGSSLATLIGAFTSGNGVPDLPFDLSGQLQVTDAGYGFRGVNGKLGTSEVKLDGVLVPQSGIVGSRFNLIAGGAAFNELIDQFGDLGVRPGPYELSGAVDFQAQRIIFNKLELNRANASIDLDLELGLPVSARSAVFDLRASGPNVQSILSRLDAFKVDEAPFLIDLDGAVEGSAWSIENLDVQVGLAKLHAEGDLNVAGAATATQLQITADVPDVAALGKLGERRLHPQSLRLDGNVTSGAGELFAKNLLLRLGESDIRGDILYVAGDVPDLEMQLVSDALIIAPLLAEQENPSEALETALDDGRLIPNVDIPFAMLASIDAEVSVAVGRLQRGALDLRDIFMRAELAKGRLDLAEFRLNARSGNLRARAYLDPGDGEGEASVELVARQFALGMSENNQDLAMTGDIDIKLESTGSNLRALLGNATGVVFVDSRGGRMAENRALQALYGSALQEIIGAINPFSKSDEYTDFECIVLPVEINAGILSSNPNSLIATNKIQIATKSEIDLKTEELETNISTTPKKGISISAGEIVNPYIKVVGTLAEPRLAVDETGVLISGGAAFATGGLSILARAAWTRLSRSKDPCGSLAAEGRTALSDRFPSFAE